VPSKYVIRNFAQGGVYHVFNRGVEKRNIFMSTVDYKIFLYYLFIYLTPLDRVLKSYPNLPFRLQGKNLAKEVEVLSYCFMPNHFHFLLKQITKDGITKFMKQITNGYTEYFNKKYKRDGGLMQGRYKAIQIETDNALIHISRYIHLNPVVADMCSSAEVYEWSSAKEFIKNTSGICKKDLILSQFNSPLKYEQFLQDHIDYARELEGVKYLTIDE
jgi:putative transposase